MQTTDPRQLGLESLFDAAAKAGQDPPASLLTSGDNVDAVLSRLRLRLEQGFTIVASAPTFSPPFVQLTWWSLARMREDPHGYARVVQCSGPDALRDCLLHAEDFERIADGRGIRAADAWHAERRREREKRA